MSLAAWESKEQFAACSCIVCGHSNAQFCIKNRCNCCSTDHAYLLTNTVFEESIAREPRLTA